MKKSLTLFVFILVIIFTFASCNELYYNENSGTVSSIITGNQLDELKIGEDNESNNTTSEENIEIYIYLEYACNDYLIGSSNYNGKSVKLIVYCNNALEFKTFNTVCVDCKESQIYNYINTITFTFFDDEFDFTTEKRIDNPASVRLSDYENGEPVYDKPVIYLYPTEPTEVDVKLDFVGTLTVTIPEYNDGWKVTAYPDGTLVDENGTEYPYLFWEGKPDNPVKITEGFCVAGNETEIFLRKLLPYLGLIETEYEEFIDFWVPRMEGNVYNLIQFQTEIYTDNAILKINPEPDSILRVFMSFTAVDEYTKIPTQTLETFKRFGFTVIEWGGCEING